MLMQSDALCHPNSHSWPPPASPPSSRVFIDLGEESIAEFGKQIRLYEVQGHDENFLILMVTCVLAKWDLLVDYDGEIINTTVRRDR